MIPNDLDTQTYLHIVKMYLFTQVPHFISSKVIARADRVTGRQTENLVRFSFSTQIWHFCTKLTSRVLKSKKKLPPVGFELTTATISGLEFELPYTLSQSVSPWQSQIFTPLQSHALLIIEMIQLHFKDFLLNRCLDEWVGQICVEDKKPECVNKPRLKPQLRFLTYVWFRNRSQWIDQWGGGQMNDVYSLCNLELFLVLSRFKS